MISGGIAGCIGKTATAPLSRLTVLYQVGPLLEQAQARAAAAAASAASSSSSSSKPTVPSQPIAGSPSNAIIQDSLWKTLRTLVQREGFLSLWNGNLTSVIHRFPYSAINFASYEYAKSYLGSGDDHHDSSYIRLTCGAISGATSCISCYPLDIVRTRLTVGGSTGSMQSSGSSSSSLNGAAPKSSRGKILGLVLQIIEREGIFGLYRGLGASLSVAMPNLAIGFTVYGKLKETMIDRNGFFVNHSTGHLNSYGALLSGSISGACSSLVMFPMDVIRKRMQVMGVVPTADTICEETATVSKEKLKSKGMTYHARMIFAHSGIRGFYRGLASEILKVCPMVAITFCSYELVKDSLDSVFPSV
jgi:hypothetical protein